MPHEDADAAEVIERVFRARGMTILTNARADVRASAPATACVVTLADGRTVDGSHALMAVGSVPNTDRARPGRVRRRGRAAAGYVTVDRVSRTNVPGIYAAGDCTGVLPLASVAAMQGRIAMWHALGEAVAPLRLQTVVGQRLHRPGAGHGRACHRPMWTPAGCRAGW